MSFANPRQPARRGVPLAPMLDVLFLLLIFFAMTSSIRANEQLIDIDVPVASTGESEPGRVNETIVNITADNRILVNGEPRSIEQLHELLTNLIGAYPEERIIVRGHTEAEHGRIMSVFDAARAAGATDIRVATKRDGEGE